MSRTLASGLTIAMLFCGGCASTGALTQTGEADYSSTHRRAAPSVRVGDAQVVASQIDPRTPVGVTAEGEDLVVHFARPRRPDAVSRVDAASLKPLSEDQGDGPGRQPGAAGSNRIVLDDGHFVVLWTRGSAEWGYRALAQSFNASGSPLGAPVVISPPSVDVIGLPSAVTTDGRHVVATFAASTGTSFDVLAVSIDDVTAPAFDAEPLARR